jgi:hypothetical protein
MVRILAEKMGRKGGRKQERKKTKVMRIWPAFNRGSLWLDFKLCPTFEPFSLKL